MDDMTKFTMTTPHPVPEGSKAIDWVRESAPELLEALKLAAAIIGHPDDEGSKFIAAAIAKAEGK